MKRHGLLVRLLTAFDGRGHFHSHVAAAGDAVCQDGQLSVLSVVAHVNMAAVRVHAGPGPVKHHQGPVRCGGRVRVRRPDHDAATPRPRADPAERADNEVPLAQDRPWTGDITTPAGGRGEGPGRGPTTWTCGDQGAGRYEPPGDAATRRPAPQHPRSLPRRDRKR